MKPSSIYLFIICFIIGASSCGSPQNTKIEHVLCQRNAFSKNGVEAMYHYSFETKEGIIDRNSRQLYSIERFDSLGNIVYYKGDYYPGIGGFDVSTYHYEIRDELDLPWDMTYTYKMEYQDTVLTKASIFNEDGKYIARIEEQVKGNIIDDSVYVRDRLIYVQHIIKDVNGQDSLRMKYDNKISPNLSLVEEVKYTYIKSGNVLRENIVNKERDFLHPRSGRFDTRTYSFELTYNEKGQLIKGIYGESTITYSYDENGHGIESINEDGRRKTKTLYKNEYDEYGLLRRSSGYADMTICDSYSEYEYSYFPYSKLSTLKKNK